MERSLESRREEGKRRAAERRAELSPEILAKVEALENGIAALIERTFVGPPNSKGRCALYFATPEEIEEFRKDGR